MSMSNDTVYAPADIEVLPCNDKEVSLTNSIIDITPCESTEISVRKKEYTIISDGLYIPEGSDAAPPWVTDLIDDAVNPWIGDHIIDLTIAGKSLSDALDALEIAHNAYNEMVYVDVRVDRAIAMHLTTLNSRLDSNDASIINLNVTRVTPEEAAAISVRSISSSLNGDSPDSIGGRFTSVGSSISTLAGNVTKTQDLLESRYGELNDAVASLEVEVGAAIDGVYSSFLYDSTLRVGDDSYKSGFGLNASVKIPVPGQPGVYHSEFWIDAQRFKFTNSNQTGAVSPFTIDASGALPQISFNGAVSFSNVTGPDKPEAGATKNEFRGAWTTGTVYRKGDVVTTGGNSWSAKLDHTATSGNRPPALSSNLSSTWLLNAAKGNSVTTVNIYRRSAAVLGDSHKPTSTSTYNFETNTITGLNNSWTFSIPEGTDPLYVAVASVAAEGTTPTGTIKGSQWSTPIKYVENGLNSATVFVFKRTSSDTVPTKPGGTSTYSFKTQSLTTSPTNDWSEGLPSTGGSYRWMSKATAASTGDTDNITATEWSTPRLLAEDGIQGAQGNTGAEGQDARAVKLVASKTVLKYSTAGKEPTPTVLSFTATSVNATGTLKYRFFVNDVAVGAANTSNTYTYSAPSTMLDTPTSIEVELYEGSTLVARDEVTVISLRDGASVVAATLSNEAHVVPSSPSGGSPLLGGSGTTLRVFEGIVPLTFLSGSNQYPAANTKGTYNVERVFTGLVAPSLLGTNTTTLSQLDYTAMTADLATTVFNIRIRRLDGTTEMLTKVQTLSKSKQGVQGTNGTKGSNGAATTTVYKRDTNAVAPVSGYDNPPSGWYSSVPFDDGLPVWECVGNHNGDGSWVWQPPKVSATFWTKPNTTRIDGNKIFTGDAYVDTLQIKGRAITVNEYADLRGRRLLKHDDESGPWETFISKEVVHPGYNQGATGIIIIVNFSAEGYGDTDVDCRVIRSGWESHRSKNSVFNAFYSSFTALFYDPYPSVDPSYDVQFRINDTTGTSDGLVGDMQVVFMSGKR